MKKWDILMTISVIVFILFLIQFIVVGFEYGLFKIILPWQRFAIFGQYPIPIFGMFGSVLGMGISMIGMIFEQNKKGRK